MTDSRAEFDRVFREGMAAWRRRKEDKSWENWLKVGTAHIAGREQAMHEAQTDRPEGKAYDLAFNKWLVKFKLHDMRKGERSRLFEVMDNLVAIEAWRMTLAQTERLKLNHPSSILRKWKREIKLPQPAIKSTVPYSLAALDQKIRDLRQHVKESEASQKRLKSENENLRAEVAQLEYQVGQLNENCSELRKDRDRLQAELNQIDHDLLTATVTRSR